MQLQSSYHAGRCECGGMSSDDIVGSAAYDGALPVVSTRADEYSVVLGAIPWIDVGLHRAPEPMRSTPEE